MMFLRLLCLMLVAVFIYACGDADKNKKEEKPLESLAKDQSETNVKEDSLEKKYGKPIYFPFCKREGKIAVNQTYFAKLPIEFLDVIK